MADIVWEGTAAMSRYGEFPIKGFYGATNSFPINTIISVENIKNKNTIEVIIVDNLNDNNLFILLSKDAAEMLDIKQDEILSIKAQVIKEAADKKVLSANPDTTILSNVAELENILSKDTAADSSVASSANTLSGDKVPQKMVIIYDEESSSNVVEVKTAEVVNEDLAMEEVVISDLDPESNIIKEKSDSSAIARAKSVDEEIFAPTEGYYENGEKRYFLRPTELKPPVVDDRDDTALSGLVADDTTVVPPSVKDYSKIIKESYYVQLIAFKDYSSAEKVVKSVNIDYPVIIYYDEKQFLYKVMAGPLKTDERGVVLHKAKNSGYKDAFIRKGE